MKYNFLKKRKVQVYMLITTMLLCVSACAFSSFDVYADDVSYDLISIYNLDDSIFDYSKIENFPSEYIEYINNNYNNLIEDNNLTVTSDSYNVASTLFNTTNYPNYFIESSNSVTRLNFYSLPENSFILINSNEYTVYFESSYLINSRLYFAQFYSGIYPQGFSSWDFVDGLYTLTDDGIEYSYNRYTVSTNNNRSHWLTKTSVPVYSASDTTDLSTADFSTDLNYDNSEEILNHMTLDDASTRFYISNSSFNNGNLYIYAGTDEFQMNPENISNYSLRISGSCNTNFKYDNNGFNAVKYNGVLLEKYFPMSNGSSNQYNFSLNSSSGSYIDIPFASLDNNEYTISLAQLNGHFTGASGNDNSYQLIAKALDTSYAGTSFLQPVLNIIGGISVTGFKFDLAQRANDYNIVPLGILDHLDLYVYNSETNELSSVQSTIDFDFVTGTQNAVNVGTSTGDDVMNATGSNYIPSEYASTNTNTNYGGSMQNGGSSSSSSSPSVSPSISGGDNSINIVNNNTNNGGSGSSTTNDSSLLSNFSITTLLIKYIAGGKNSGVSYIEDLAGTNTYLSIVSNYMSFVPVEIWSLVITTFSVCLGCVVVAFIISIVIKIIT